ncbi:MAG: diacylglycerol/lipid kinase family protein [Phascolarctobacterium sp.]
MAINYAEVMQFKKVVIVYNRNSGKQLFASMIARINEIFKRLKDALGSKTVELREIKRFDEIPAIAEALQAEAVDWVIIAGGDGTIRAFVEQLSNRKYLPYISVFPAGTVNLVAKELLLSGDPYKWAKRVLKGVEVPVYLGRANGHVFLTVTGIGFDSLVVDNVTEKEKKLLNKLAYVLQGTEIMRKEVLFNNWRYRFEVRFDDEDQWHECSSVIVGKSRYYAGRYNLFRGASLSTPWLYTALFTGAKRADFIRYAACIAMEALGLDKDIVVRRAKRLEIRCNVEDFAAELDGDAVTTAPLSIELEEEPIKFLA